MPLNALTGAPVELTPDTRSTPCYYLAGVLIVVNARDIWAAGTSLKPQMDEPKCRWGLNCNHDPLLHNV
ncbi:hypothetical protein CEXT_770431 [Caerostris extrusa]|uniref:Uncharacterized protein n=1 Tax=Caerostris extrusa TaxID=172846 RepID=A0AAV4VGY9_CAEEX|nr:hypothetical protein CEXT_770431 [Caerostris extrusa]